MKPNGIPAGRVVAALLFLLMLTPHPAAACAAADTLAVTDNLADTLAVTDVSAGIPDPLFRAWVLEHFDTDGDAQLSPEEAAAVTHISLSHYRAAGTGERIASLEGLQLFPGLTGLYCADNDLTRLDVTGCRALKALDCSGNALSELPLDSCPALARLACHDNRLETLDLTACPALEVVLCRRNALTALTLDSCRMLARLDCSENALTALDVSRCPLLSELLCYQNRLTRLDVAGCRSLTRLMCYNNALETLILPRECAIPGVTEERSTDCIDPSTRIIRAE